MAMVMMSFSSSFLAMFLTLSTQRSLPVFFYVNVFVRVWIEHQPSLGFPFLLFRGVSAHIQTEPAAKNMKEKEEELLVLPDRKNRPERNSKNSGWTHCAVTDGSSPRSSATRPIQSAGRCS
jgi:hypothetical protein